MGKMVQLAGVGNPEQIAAIGGEMINGHTFVPVDYIQKFANDPDFLVLISEIVRPGVQLFATKVEYTLFPPGTNLNQLFNMGSFQWDACIGLPYLIIFVPSEAREYVEEIGRACDIRLVPGVPVRLGAEPEPFPISGSSVYKLENFPDSKVYAGALNQEGGFPMYQSRMQTLLAEEKKQTEEFLASHGVKEKDA